MYACFNYGAKILIKTDFCKKRNALSLLLSPYFSDASWRLICFENSVSMKQDMSFYQTDLVFL